MVVNAVLAYFARDEDDKLVNTGSFRVSMELLLVREHGTGDPI
jgi:hypothetical protein